MIPAKHNQVIHWLKNYLSLCIFENYQAALFVFHYIFFRLKPEPCRIYVLQENINQYQKYQNKIGRKLCLELPKFASGFDLQKRAISGFGLSANGNTVTCDESSPGMQETLF